VNGSGPVCLTVSRDGVLEKDTICGPVPEAFNEARGLAQDMDDEEEYAREQPKLTLATAG
jgi:hypothetical protein